jgi:probable RNA-binding protein EIF1AD
VSLTDYPIPSEKELIVQVVAPQGSNQLEVRTADGATALALLPTKYRRLVWVKRGDFLICSQSDTEYETAAGAAGRVRFIVEHVLYPEQVSYLHTAGHWPAGFATGSTETDPVTSHSAGSSDGDAASAAVSVSAAASTGVASSSAAFPCADLPSAAGDGDHDDDSDSGLPAMWQNTNRRQRRAATESDDDDEEDEDDG